MGRITELVAEVELLLGAYGALRGTLRHIAPRLSSPRTHALVEIGEQDREALGSIQRLTGARPQVDIRPHGPKAVTVDRVLFDLGAGVRLLVQMRDEREATWDEIAALGDADGLVLDVDKMRRGAA